MSDKNDDNVVARNVAKWRTDRGLLGLYVARYASSLFVCDCSSNNFTLSNGGLLRQWKIVSALLSRSARIVSLNGWRAFNSDRGGFAPLLLEFKCQSAARSSLPTRVL